MSDAKCLLELNPNRIDFQPVSKDVNVFYDESNRQLFIVIQNGSEIIVKGSDDLTFTFSVPERRPILCIKFCPTFALLSLQRSENVVDFVNFKNGQPTDCFSHRIKSKTAKILGFFWTNASEIVIVTDAGIEFNQVLADKKILKSLKTFSLTVDWFVYQHVSSMLLVANGNYCNVITTFLFRPSNVYRFTKFEIDWTNQAKTCNLSLNERNVTMTNLYGKPRLLVLRHYTILKDQAGIHILVYTFNKRDEIPQKSDILIANLSGRFAINIIDDLIVVHHQTSKSSMIFDINLSPNEIYGNIKYHLPIISQCSISPYKINDVVDYDLYSSNWAVFQPNIIIDAKLGSLWFLELKLEQIYELIKNVPILIDFLILRKNSKAIILNVCRNVVQLSKRHNQNPIGNLALIFNKLNLALKESLSTQQCDPPSQSSDFDYLKHKTAVVIDQKDIVSHFLEYFEEDGISQTMAISIIFEYINSLSHHSIPIHFFIYEFLINYLLKTKQFYQMHQFLQYHVFADSKHLACQLLSLHTQYPFAIQIGLDMLKRLNTADEEIVEVLLSQNQVVRALQYVEKHLDINSVSARKFLEAAKNTKDVRVFHQVYKFLQLRNRKLRGSVEFVTGENCESYIRYFENKFGCKNAF